MPQSVASVSRGYVDTRVNKQQKSICSLNSCNSYTALFIHLNFVCNLVQYYIHTIHTCTLYTHRRERERGEQCVLSKTNTPSAADTSNVFIPVWITKVNGCASPEGDLNLADVTTKDTAPVKVGERVPQLNVISPCHLSLSGLPSWLRIFVFAGVKASSLLHAPQPSFSVLQHPLQKPFRQPHCWFNWWHWEEHIITQTHTGVDYGHWIKATLHSDETMFLWT